MSVKSELKAAKLKAFLDSERVNSKKTDASSKNLEEDNFENSFLKYFKNENEELELIERTNTPKKREAAIREMLSPWVEKIQNVPEYKNGKSTFDTWKQLGTFLIVKYNDGVVKRVKDGQFERNSIGQPAGVIRPGYPKEFLEEYVKQTGERYLVK